MGWDSLLYLSILGTVVTLAVTAWVTGMGIRYRRELPKLPIKESLVALRLEREREEAALADMQDAIAQARDEIREGERVREFLDTARPQMEQLQMETRRLQEAKQKADLEAAAALEDLEKRLQEVAKVTAERDRLKEEIAPLRVDLAELKARLERAQEDLQQYEAKREKLEQIEAQLPGLREEHALLSRKVEEMRAESGKLGTALTNLRNESASRTAELTGVKAQIERAQASLQQYKAKCMELTRIEAQLPGLREEHTLLSRKVDDMGVEVAKFEGALPELRREHAQLEGALAGLKEQRDVLLESIQELNRTHSSAGGLDQNHDACQDLWMPYFQEKPEADRRTDEVERLNDMDQQLRRVEVRIPRRTLLAFHTALKIQDISPITVLAGISGTGKSLLPRLYSKCMGLHFLNLPVQPGWNSPQDLFGFYNYMERRYKATPLARALVQFDQYNRDSWPLPPENVAFEDQLLLVLLDEMNLARVEYYFSELLSRLEIRRSIDADDGRERQKVEIPLEIGHAVRRPGDGVSGPPVSVFPGENVLFTGTMNEDESTMSLSDKVLDRATVLRFGRPAKTVSHQPSTPDLRMSLPLALSTWKRWLEPNPVHHEIASEIETLGDIMAEAGAPFGHRVAQGILRYISLYPDPRPAGQRSALVDQVEQKILPKFRGRELGSIQEAVRSLIQLVRRMEDPQLERAIKDGENEGEDTFMWFGLDRKEE